MTAHFLHNHGIDIYHYYYYYDNDDDDFYYNATKTGKKKYHYCTCNDILQQNRRYDVYTNDNNEIIVSMYDEMIILIIEGIYTGGIPHQEPPLQPLSHGDAMHESDYHQHGGVQLVLNERAGYDASFSVYCDEPSSLDLNCRTGGVQTNLHPYYITHS